MYFDFAPAPRVVENDPLIPYGPVLSPREFVGQRALYYGCSADMVRGPFKSRLLMDIRICIARELRAMRFSLPEIGRAMNRDHTSVLWMIRGGKRRRRK